MVHLQDRIDMPWGRSADAARPAGSSGDYSGPLCRRTTMWLQAGLLALAPLLVVSFYSVVDDAVEHAAMRRVAPPARSLQTDGLRPVTWECSALPGAGVHNACRPIPLGGLAGERTAGS